MGYMNLNFFSYFFLYLRLGVVMIHYLWCDMTFYGGCVFGRMWACRNGRVARKVVVIFLFAFTGMRLFRYFLLFLFRLEVYK